MQEIILRGLDDIFQGSINPRVHGDGLLWDGLSASSSAAHPPYPRNNGVPTYPPQVRSPLIRDPWIDVRVISNRAIANWLDQSIVFKEVAILFAWEILRALHQITIECLHRHVHIPTASTSPTMTAWRQRSSRPENSPRCPRCSRHECCYVLLCFALYHIQFRQRATTPIILALRMNLNLYYYILQRCLRT